jgi:hypothetical protein
MLRRLPFRMCRVSGPPQCDVIKRARLFGTKLEAVSVQMRAHDIHNCLPSLRCVDFIHARSDVQARACVAEGVSVLQKAVAARDVG